MSTETSQRYQQVLDDYAALEPGSSDTWNPLQREVELEHRIELMRQLVAALHAGEQDPDELVVVDVGCGTGRSTRMYLDLGLAPEQLAGLDLRSGALRRARSLNPAIRWLQVGAERWPIQDASVSWISVCTVFSSIRDGDERRHLAGEITRILSPAGQLFFWDRSSALDFAGADALDPTEWFSGLDILWQAPADVSGYDGPSPTHGGWLLQRAD